MKLKTKDRWIVFTMAVVGMGACFAGVTMFFLTMLNNTLPWEHAATAPQHYLAVGKSYSQGFTIGFFLAFSLALVAVSFAAWADDQRRARRARQIARSPRTMDTRLVLGLRAPSRDVA